MLWIFCVHLWKSTSATVLLLGCLEQVEVDIMWQLTYYRISISLSDYHSVHLRSQDNWLMQAWLWTQAGVYISAADPLATSCSRWNGVMGWFSWQSVGLEILWHQWPEFEPHQEHTKNCEFFWVKNDVLTRCWCTQPQCVYARIRMIIYGNTLKIPCL